jgi:hypothetical protein
MSDPDASLSPEQLHRLELKHVINDLDGEIEELEATVVYWQTLFGESQKEAATLRARIRELEAQIKEAYTDERPMYLEDAGIAPQLSWGIFSSVKSLTRR